MALLAAAPLLGPGIARGAALIQGSYAINFDEEINRTDAGTEDRWTFKHGLDLKYKGLFGAVVQNEVTFKIEQEIKSDVEPASITRLQPGISLGFKGSAWNAGAKTTIEDSTEPERNPKITDSYFVEYFLRPARRTLPDLKAKYTLDKDSEAGATDTVKHGVTLSTVYVPSESLEFKGDYEYSLNDDKLTTDADAENDKISGAVGLRRLVTDKARIASEFKAEVLTSATLPDAGGKTNQTETRNQTWKNTVALRPFPKTDVDGSYDYDRKHNAITGQVSLSNTFKAAAAQKVLIFNVKGDFSRVVTEDVNTLNDNRKTEDTWTGEVKARPTKIFDVSLKYQTKTTAQEFEDPSKNTSTGSNAWNAAWTGDITPIWKASAAFDRTENIEDERKSSVDRKYALKTTVDLKRINLTLDPTYDITLKEDFKASPVLETEIRDFKFKIAWVVFRTAKMESKFDHTYGRRTDTGAQNVERTDSTAANLAWSEPFTGWLFGFDLTRSATDKSEDDLPPDVTAALAFKANYTHQLLQIGTSYRYDLKRLTDDSETFDAKVGWKAGDWDLSLTYSFSKTFSEALDETYRIAVAFKYNL